jgi:hypothetical protein
VWSSLRTYALLMIFWHPFDQQFICHWHVQDMFVANTQQRGTGLVFANGDHSTVALPHLTGEKWGAVHQDIMMVQRCGTYF